MSYDNYNTLPSTIAVEAVTMEEPLLPLDREKMNPVPSVKDTKITEDNSKKSGYPFWLIFVVIPGLLLNSALAIYLTHTARTNKTFTSSFYIFTTKHQASILQLLSQVLGSLQILVITELFNAFTRKWFQKRAISLDCLKWWNSMCQKGLDFDLPLHFMIPLLIFVGLSTLPAAFWAGAITPIPVSKAETGGIELPQYGPDPQTHFWNQTSGAEPLAITRNQLGSFSYSPVLNILGSMLDEASLAIAPDSFIQTHRKLDNSGYTYKSRSYGVGSSVGLSNTTLDPNLKQYSFFENGYESDVTCGYNDTMDFHVYLGQKGTLQAGVQFPDIYFACGYTLAGTYECVAFPGYTDNEVVAMLGHTINGVNQWALATGTAASTYTALNQTSCNVVFTPRRFLVNVNSTDMSISVTRTMETAKDIDPSSDGGMQANGRIAMNVVLQMGMVSQATASAAFSPLGNALIANIANAKVSQSNGFLSSNLNSTQLSLLGIESSLSAMADDILLAYASAQLVIAGAENNGISLTSMNATVSAMQIGEPHYIYTVTSITFFLVALVIIETVRNRGWKGQSSLDYRDLKSVIIGTSINGDAIAREVKKREPDKWVADPRDRIAGGVLVTLDEGPGLSVLPKATS